MAADKTMAATWIIADQQTAGRGRRGRRWVSPTGNLMATLYLPHNVVSKMDTHEAGQLGFVAGLALEHTVRHFIGDAAAVTLKWPNDVLIDGAKASGILLESAMQNNKLGWLAIGLGLNLTTHPDDTPYPATNILAVKGAAPSHLEALEVLAAAFDTLYRHWQINGFATVLNAWRMVAHGLGQPMTARLEQTEITGTFLDIDEKGALLLQDETGAHHKIDAGDVYFPTEGANNLNC